MHLVLRASPREPIFLRLCLEVWVTILWFDLRPLVRCKTLREKKPLYEAKSNILFDKAFVNADKRIQE